MTIAPLNDTSAAIPVQDRTFDAQQRAAIDVVAISRTAAITCSLFGTNLCRPNPNKPHSDEVRRRWVAEMEVQYDAIARACALVGGRDPQGELSDEICIWMAQCSQKNTPEVGILNEMLRLTRKLIDDRTNTGDGMENLLAEHCLFARTTFLVAVKTLCNAFWTDIDRLRHAEVRRAHDSDAAIGTTLKRLEHIGKHVRLVSLNASVEAARVGDAGKGLGVIAQEFKSLAEEIQRLAHRARENTDSALK